MDVEFRVPTSSEDEVRMSPAGCHWKRQQPAGLPQPTSVPSHREICSLRQNTVVQTQLCGAFDQTSKSEILSQCVVPPFFFNLKPVLETACDFWNTRRCADTQRRSESSPVQILYQKSVPDVLHRLRTSGSSDLPKENLGQNTAALVLSRVVI